MEEIKLLMVKEVMNMTGVSRRTVYNWMKDGKVKFIYTPGGGRRIFSNSIWYTEKRRFKKVVNA